jgi:phosphate transport system substrate-binding protein
MAYTRGRCTNFDYCALADSRKDAEIPVGEDFICPECGKPLKAPPVGSGGGGGVLITCVVLGVLALVGGAVYLGMRLAQNGGVAGLLGGAPAAAPPVPVKPVAAVVPAAKPAPATPPAPAPAPASPPAPAETVLVRMAGSAEIGEGLAPALAAAYLAQIGDTDVKTVAGPKPGQVKIAGLRGAQSEAIIVENSTATDGFKSLGGGGADVVMATRRIAPAEHDLLNALGDMTSAAAEHVVAIDALAVVVNPANPLSAVRRDQVKDIFTGSIADWRVLGGAAAPIDVYAVTPQSEQGATFAPRILGGNPLASGAKLLADPRQVAESVAADPQGIGVVDLRNIGTLRALTIAETGSPPESPANLAAIATEDYPLSYRLYLYTAPGLHAGFAQKFVDFALSPPGQKVVEQAGLVSQTAKPEAPAVQTTLDRLKGFIAGTRKLGIIFHFQPNSTELDQPGKRDLDRVRNYFVSNHYAPDEVRLAGFADNQGDPTQNVAVSKKRADAVADLFRGNGFTIPPANVEGFGGELPVADNATEEGRNKNRRVEVYVPK